MNRLVIDASVVLKWYLPDEEYGDTAIWLLRSYLTGDLEIVAPSLLEYELANGLIIAARKGRIRDESIVSALEGFGELGLRLVQPSGLYGELVGYCRTYHRSAYDASYLALAAREGVNLITADERLYNRLKEDLAWVKWLGDLKTRG